MAEFNMEKTYNPQAIERETYEKWESSGAFTPKIDKSKKPFTIVMPPPQCDGSAAHGPCHGRRFAGQPYPLSPHEG